MALWWFSMHVVIAAVNKGAQAGIESLRCLAWKKYAYAWHRCCALSVLSEPCHDDDLRYQLTFFADACTTYVVRVKHNIYMQRPTSKLSASTAGLPLRLCARTTRRTHAAAGTVARAACSESRDTSSPSAGSSGLTRIRPRSHALCYKVKADEAGSTCTAGHTGASQPCKC